MPHLFRTSRRAASACALALCLGAGSANAESAGAQASWIGAEPSNDSTRLPNPATDYTLASGDLLRILVYQQPDLSMEVRIQDNGQLTYPLVGPLMVAGQTVVQAERLIEEGLRRGGYLRSPQVGIQVVQVRGHLVSVLGHVQRPGRFPIEKPGLRLSEVLAQAGGVTAIGADSLTLMGLRQGRQWRITLDLASLFESGDRSLDPILEHGDTVFVDRAAVVYLYGEVQRPGPLRLERQMTVLQALAAGGGPTARGTTRGLKVTRREDHGGWLTWKPDMAAVLKPGDVVHVPESLF
ncbi:MAG: polysaccharide export protein EpsE [Pseudomonadota bacterium]|jgi:polysaccharide export outer membrane protein